VIDGLLVRRIGTAGSGGDCSAAPAAAITQEAAQSGGSYMTSARARLSRLAAAAAASSAAAQGGRMDLKLKPFDFAQAAARAGLRPDGQPLARGVQQTGQGSFQSAMSQALRSVSDAQLQSQTLQRELQLDNPAVSLEQTMVAMQKAQLGFQATLQVRNRLVQAYSDIMNMQV